MRFPSVAGKGPSMQLLFRKILRAVTMLPREEGMAPVAANSSTAAAAAAAAAAPGMLHGKHTKTECEKKNENKKKKNISRGGIHVFFVPRWVLITMPPTQYASLSGNMYYYRVHVLLSGNVLFPGNIVIRTKYGVFVR